MDPREFHTLAVRLAAGRTSAERRTSIGRSYYATFNVAAGILRAMGFHIGRGASAHGEVRYCLGNSGDAPLAIVASELAKLHAWRIRADYELDRADVETAGNADAMAKLAEGLIKSMDASFSGPNRPQIQAAIAAWRRANGYP